MNLVSWFLHIVLIFALAWYLHRKQDGPRIQFWSALVLKLAAGICLGWLYTIYYSSGDTFRYFADASALASLARQDLPAYLGLVFLNDYVGDVPLNFHEPRALFLIKILSVFNLLTQDNYWISSLYFSLVSFAAAWYLVHTIRKYIPTVATASAVAFLFFPSIVFWTSGLLKESLAMAALFYLSALFLRQWFGERFRLPDYVLAVVSLIVFWNLKYYYVAVFIPVVVTSFLYRFFIRQKSATSPGRQALIWFAIFVLPLVLVTFLHPNFGVGRILEVIVENNAAYIRISEPGDVIAFEDLRPTPMSLLVNTPWAVFSGLFRPLFWEAETIPQLAAGVENSMLLLLFLASLLRWRRFMNSPHRLLVLTAIVFVILTCALIALSAPNFGTLSRYRTGFLAFFVFITLCDNPVVEYLQRSIARLGSN